MSVTKLFVISGPSGVGKDTIINHLKSRDKNWYFVVTATTRSIREGEKDGKDYLFLTHDQFQAMLDRDQFLENAEVYGNRYGVPVSQVDIAKHSNRHAILKIDVQGALTIKSKFDDAILIFVQPESIDQLISAKSIAARVETLAKDITNYFLNTEKLIVVGLLRGSFVFIADLAREIDLPIEIDFLEASSYGNSTESSREVKILKDLAGEISGKDVLVVEDIVDTGHTLKHVLQLLNSRNPRRIEACALLDKPTRREVEIKSRWTGFEIPDEFVVGYGIDYAQMNRNLSYIGKVRFNK